MIVTIMTIMAIVSRTAMIMMISMIMMFIVILRAVMMMIPKEFFKLTSTWASSTSQASQMHSKWWYFCR